MAYREAPKWIHNSNYVSVRRHFQFSDIHNGSWYVEILSIPGNITRFIVREVRNGEIRKQTREPKTFQEANKIFWNRTHTMSLEAGIESLPPPMPKIEWG